MIRVRRSEQDYYSLIGERVKYYREKKKMPVVELSRITGISRYLISSIENCEVGITVIQLEKIARALNISLEDFLPTKKIEPFTRIIKSDKNESDKVLEKTKTAIRKLNNKDLSANLIRALDAIKNL